MSLSLSISLWLSIILRCISNSFRFSATRRNFILLKKWICVHIGFIFQKTCKKIISLKLKKLKPLCSFFHLFGSFGNFFVQLCPSSFESCRNLISVDPSKVETTYRAASSSYNGVSCQYGSLSTSFKH